MQHPVRLPTPEHWALYSKFPIPDRPPLPTIISSVGQRLQKILHPRRDNGNGKDEGKVGSWLRSPFPLGLSGLKTIEWGVETATSKGALANFRTWRFRRTLCKATTNWDQWNSPWWSWSTFEGASFAAPRIKVSSIEGRVSKETTDNARELKEEGVGREGTRREKEESGWIV